MTLYRGPGGTGSATSDADTTLYQDFLNQTQAARDAALQAETNAELAETNAETAETNAETAATAAASSASAAASSASSASTSATNAASSVSSASTSASNASSSASSASSSASAASTSATNAASSATAAASSASAASTSATNAASSATSASNSASTATTQATNAASSATAAASSATAAQSARTAAEAARDAALSAYDNFDDRYLGPKASDPTLDNDGNALVTGALYFNTATNVMKVYDGSTWVAAYVSAAGVLLVANNLSDVASTATARANLNVPTRTGGDASGTWGINVTGNAATVTNGVYTTGDQTIAGTKTFSSNPILSGGTANGVAYLNGSKVLTTGSALTFDGTNLGVGQATPTVKLQVDTASASGDLVGWFRQSTFPVAGIRSGSGYAGFGQSAASSETRIFADGASSFITNYLGGSEQMRLNSTGLGIGTSSPSYKLDARLSGTSSGAVIQVGNTGSGGFGGLGVSDGGAYPVQMWGSALSFLTGSSLYGSATEKMRLDSSGNLGLGVTPSAWASRTVFEVGSAGNAFVSGGAGDVYISEGAYYNNGWKYGNSLYAVALYNQYRGTHSWNYAAAGTAGNAISFTQAMTLDASGRLAIGVTGASSNVRLAVSGAIKRQIVTNGTSGSPAEEAGLIYDDGGDSNRTGIYFFNNFSSAGDSWMSFKTMSNNVVAERARIDSSGNFLIGKTTTSQSTAGTILYGGGSSNAAYFTGTGSVAVYVNRETSDGTVIDIRRAASTVGTISVTTTATAYNTSSDYRLKENIQPMIGALAKVQALKPCTYNWKADGSAGEGFIAHELAEVVPQAVTGQKDAVDVDGNPQYQGIDTSFLVATLTAAIQELKAEFDAYKATHP